MYPVNHKFYNLLAEKVNLTVFQIGSYPVHHENWTSENIRKGKINYKLKIFSKGKVSFIKTLNPNIIFQMKKECPDIVLSIAFWMPSLFLSLLKNIFSYKFIILTNAISETEKNISFFKYKLRKKMVRNIDMFISASNLTTQYLKNELRAKNISLSIQTSDINMWKNSFKSIDDKNVLREKANIELKKKVMLGLGNFIEKKNWKKVLKSLVRVDNILFILIGEGEQEKEYKTLIETLNIKEKVRILGRKEGKELLEYFKISDFLIFPSLYDQYGFVTPEALSVGLPVICSKNVGSECLIDEGVNGFLIDPNKDCSKIIVKTSEHLDKLKASTMNNLNNLSLENRVDEFYNIFKQLLEVSKK